MDSLWTHQRARHFPALSGSIRVDVAIIGAGLSGMGAAFALKDSGLRTAVLDSGTVAGAASGRNAGFLLAGPAMLYSDAVGKLGAREAQLLWGFTVENNETIAAIIEQYGISCGFLRRGSMSLAASTSETEQLLRAHGDLTEHGIACCPVNREFLPEPFDHVYQSGLYYPGNAELDPASFVRGVAEVVSEAVTIYEDSPVTSLERAGNWRIETRSGSVDADLVLLCTNAFTSKLLPEVPIEGKRGQVLATVPVSSVIVPFPMYADHGFQYWRQTPDGRIIIGGWRNLDFEGENTSRNALNPSIQAALDRFLATVASNHEPTVEFRWSGIMGFTPDNLPFVGGVPSNPGLYVAAGYSGHGVAMAFTCGSRLALTASGQASVIPAAFRLDRLVTA